MYVCMYVCILISNIGRTTLIHRKYIRAPLIGTNIK
jgi:hypothetical protein